jgi:putative membrane protein insertion efficiency factor
MKTVFIKLIEIYQRYISVFMSPSCRFHPTCSEYMINAVSEYGALKGFFLGLKRLCCCHPFHKGGFDPVPLKSKRVIS